jgi:transposase InsO family protein
VGAEALRRSVPGISRRMAAVVKAETTTAMERERKRSLERIKISRPGVLRGFDAMELAGRYFLVACDGSVPFRTSWALVARYTGKAVARFLEADFRRHGPPLVIRYDRARQHETRTVKRVLERHEVLALHGPPNRPTYYGQLERQNAEHRAWLSRAQAPEPVQLPVELAAMVDALNRKWRRRELSWKTAAEAWNARPELEVERSALREEVRQSERRLRRQIDLRGKPTDLPERLAIEQALARRGLLIRKHGGWC